MSRQPFVHAVLVFVPILTLLAVGVIVTVRSGLSDGKSPGTTRRLLLNLTQLAGALAVCLLFLALLQMAVGFNLALMW